MAEELLDDVILDDDDEDEDWMRPPPLLDSFPEELPDSAGDELDSLTESPRFSLAPSSKQKKQRIAQLFGKWAV